MRFLAYCVGITKCSDNPNPNQNLTQLHYMKFLGFNKWTPYDVLENCHESHYVHILGMYAGRKQKSGLCASAAKELNQGIPGTNPTHC